MLMITPMPAWAIPFRPDWVALVIIYWSIALPKNFGVGTAFGIGILADVATDTLLGQHALAYTAMSYIALLEHQRLRVAPAIQQAFIAALLLLVHRVILLLISGLVGQHPHSYSLYFAPVLISAALWPWAFSLLRALRRRYRMT